MTASDLLRRFEALPGGPVRFRHMRTIGSNVRTSRTHVWLWLARVRELLIHRNTFHIDFNEVSLTRISFDMSRG
jgi:hypothetical protein